MIFDVFRKPLTVLRKSGGHVENYEWVEGLTTTLTIKASVQPIKGQMLSAVPEGFRAKASYALFTNSELRTLGNGYSEPDIVIIGNDKFICIQILAWQNGLIPHYKVIVSRLDKDDA
jgi:hypothetical protein